MSHQASPGPARTAGSPLPCRRRAVWPSLLCGSVRGRGSQLRDHRALPARPLRQCAGRPAARPPERHPRVRPGRGRRCRHHRRQPRRRGAGGRRDARRARLRPLHARGGGARRCGAAGHRRLDGLRVATAYPVSTRDLLDALGVRAELVPVSGSVEATPRLGLADAIVDLVSTGSTMDANGLRRVGVLLESQAVLIGTPGRRRTGRSRRAPWADAVGRRRCEGPAVRDDERDRRGAPGDPEVLPSMGAPTVMPLADEGQIAVHAAVDVSEIWSVLPALKEAGRHLDPRRSRSRGSSP